MPDIITLTGTNRDFVLVFISHVVNRTGNWINFIGALKLLLEICPENQLALSISVYMILRFIPPILLAPLLNRITIPVDKRIGIAFCDVFAAASVLGLVAVKKVSDFWLFYLVVFLQQCFMAHYDRMRKTLISQVVNEVEEKKVAHRADAFAWPVSVAIGCTLGAQIANQYGTDSNFLVDATTHVISAIAILQINNSAYRVIIPLHEDKEQSGLSGDSSLALGFRHIMALPQRDILYICMMKGSGGLLWGVSELIEVEMATKKKMHTWGGFGSTISYIYLATALGSIIGPMIANALTRRSSPGALKLSVVVAFGVSTVAYAFMVVAQSIYFILASSLLRAGAGAVVWRYSTHVVQHRVSPSISDRVHITEQWIFMVCKAIGLFAGGLIIDCLRKTPKRTAGYVLLIGAAEFLFWTDWAVQDAKKEKRIRETTYEDEAKPDNTSIRGGHPLAEHERRNTGYTPAQSSEIDTLIPSKPSFSGPLKSLRVEESWR